MTPEELKQLGELAKRYEAKDKDAVLKIVKDDVHDVFQEINDGGRAAANKDNETKVKKATDDLAEANKKLVKAEKDLADLNGQAPDAAKLRQKYETDLQAERESFQKKEQGLKDQLKDSEKDHQLSKLVDVLHADFDVDRDYAETVLARKDEHTRRIVIGDDRKLTVLKKGTELPLVPPSDGKKTLLHLLAEDMVQGLDPKWKTSKVNRGSALSGSGGGDVTGKKEEFDKIRTSVKEREKAATKVRSESSSGLERLRGGRR